MHYEKLIPIWNSIFQKLGFRESKFNNWFYDSGDLITVLSLKVDEKEKDFSIDMGILFKKLHSQRSLKKPVLDNYDIGLGLFSFLWHMGEQENYLNNLFCYHSEINTEDEIINNSLEIAKLFKLKVVPYIQKLDSYTWLEEDDFEEVESWKPFLKYFRPAPQHDYYFYGELEDYCRRRKNL